MTTQHPPAFKVGGRRISITSRDKPPKAPTETSAGAQVDASELDDSTSSDYPRPERPNHDVPGHHEHPLDYVALDEQARKVKDKKGSHRSVKAKEYEDLPAAKKEAVRAGRIAQPAGKAIDV